LTFFFLPFFLGHFVSTLLVTDKVQCPASGSSLA
jgi:hypothetical protein